MCSIEMCTYEERKGMMIDLKLPEVFDALKRKKKKRASLLSVEILQKTTFKKFINVHRLKFKTSS